MRRFALLFDKEAEGWVLLFQYLNEDPTTWFVYLKDMADEYVARELLNSLTRTEQSRLSDSK